MILCKFYLKDCEYNTELEEVLKKLGVVYENYEIEDCLDLSEKYEVETVPTLILIEKDGTIVAKHSGDCSLQGVTEFLKKNNYITSNKKNDMGLIDKAIHFLESLKKNKKENIPDNIGENIIQEKNQNESNELLLDSVNSVLSDLGCRIERSEKKYAWRHEVTYQGSVFLLDVIKDRPIVVIAYYASLDNDIETFSTYKAAVNEINEESSPVKATYSVDEERNSITVRLMVTTYLNNETITNDFITSIFDEIHRAVFSIRSYADKNKTNNETPENELYNEYRNARRGFLLNEYEFAARHKIVVPFKVREDLKLTELVKMAYDVKVDQVNDITVVSRESGIVYSLNHPVDKETTYTEALGKTDTSDIKNQYYNNAIILIRYTDGIDFIENESDKPQERRIIVNIEKSSETEDSMFSRVTMTKYARGISENVEADSHENVNDTFECLMVHSKKQNGFVSEFRYKSQEAEDKLNEGRTDELTAEEKIMLGAKKMSADYDVFLGGKYYMNKLYAQAIPALRNAFDKLNIELYKGNSDVLYTFSMVCSELGSCYSNLKLYKKALYYYGHARISNNCIGTAMEYINCLVDMHDYSAISELENIERQYEDAEKNNDEDIPEYLEQLYRFAQRRMAFLHIEFGNYEKAIPYLQDLERCEDKNKEYALKELAFIEKQTKINKNLSDTEKRIEDYLMERDKE